MPWRPRQVWPPPRRNAVWSPRGRSRWNTWRLRNALRQWEQWLLIGGAIAAAALWPDVPQATITGSARIVDGDTLALQGERIRILDIDAPEQNQPCRHDDGTVVMCGAISTAALSQFIRTQPVTCDLMRRDIYGRWLSHCSVADEDIGRWLAARGLAVPYRDCACVRVRALSAWAWFTGAGIWTTSFDNPWDWRRMQ